MTDKQHSEILATLRGIALILFAIFLATMANAQPIPSCLEISIARIPSQSTEIIFGKVVAETLQEFLVTARNGCSVVRRLDEQDAVDAMIRANYFPFDRTRAYVHLLEAQNLDGWRRLGAFVADVDPVMKDAALIGAIFRNPATQRYLPLVGPVLRIAGAAIARKSPNSLQAFHELSEPHEVELLPDTAGFIRVWGAKQP